MRGTSQTANRGIIPNLLTATSNYKQTQNCKEKNVFHLLNLDIFWQDKKKELWDLPFFQFT